MLGNPSIKNCRLCDEGFCAVSVLSDSEIGILQNNCWEAALSKGEVIYHQGSLTSHIVYVRSGLVVEYQKGSGGRDQIVQIVKSRSYLALHSLFGDRINHYSYRALEDIRICHIDVDAFKHLVKENGRFAYEILVSVCKDSLSSHHRFLNINAKQTFGKVADAMLYFSNVVYGSQRFRLSLTRSDIGALIGISRESTTRALNKLQHDGIIKIEGQQISILDQQQLEKISRTG
ncbi:MAG: Crp/Fnr family transcriptional regulator [Bacteroidales bacterium]